MATSRLIRSLIDTLWQLVESDTNPSTPSNLLDMPALKKKKNEGFFCEQPKKHEEVVCRTLRLEATTAEWLEDHINTHLPYCMRQFPCCCCTKYYPSMEKLRRFVLAKHAPFVSLNKRNACDCCILPTQRTCVFMSLPLFGVSLLEMLALCKPSLVYYYSG